MRLKETNPGGLLKHLASKQTDATKYKLSKNKQGHSAVLFLVFNCWEMNVDLDRKWASYSIFNFHVVFIHCSVKSTGYLENVFVSGWHWQSLARVMCFNATDRPEFDSGLATLHCGKSEIKGNNAGNVQRQVQFSFHVLIQSDSLQSKPYCPMREVWFANRALKKAHNTSTECAYRLTC